MITEGIFRDICAQNTTMSLDMYEDAVEFCKSALKLDSKHKKSHFRLGKSLAYLNEFEKSIA